MGATPNEAERNGTRSLRAAVRALQEPNLRLVPSATGNPSRLREQLEIVNTSRLGAALAARGEQVVLDAGPDPREVSPELVLIDPALAAWAREQI
jgi:hypothetical protein